jgi:hypothetical protein
MKIGKLKKDFRSKYHDIFLHIKMLFQNTEKCTRILHNLSLLQVKRVFIGNLVHYLLINMSLGFMTLPGRKHGFEVE